MPDDRLRFGDILAALSLLGGSFLDVAIAAASPPPPPPPPAGSELSEEKKKDKKSQIASPNSSPQKADALKNKNYPNVGETSKSAAPSRNKRDEKRIISATNFAVKNGGGAGSNNQPLILSSPFLFFFFP